MVSRRAAVLSDCTVFARDLVNERADEMHPARLEEVARALAAEAGATVHVLAGEALLPAGLHMLHAVGQAARHAPRYVELLHAGDPANPKDVIMLVGKGITYDTGGLNIKPTGSMEDMHMDMVRRFARVRWWRCLPWPCPSLGIGATAHSASHPLLFPAHLPPRNATQTSPGRLCVRVLACAAAAD